MEDAAVYVLQYLIFSGKNGIKIYMYLLVYS